jgi:sugar O-acyltransferase (sialic acid O-acetyltransferase NeuD family)
MKDIAIYGAGGFGREIACLINRINKVENKWRIVGFFDDDIKLLGVNNEYGRVLGNIDVLNSWDTSLCVAIAIGSPQILKIIVEKIHNPLIDFPNLIDPSVDFFDIKNVRMGKGNIICTKGTVSCNVEIGDFNLFNVGAGIGHDVSFGNYNVIMPNVNISGGVKIGNCNMFGVKSTVLQYFKIGNNVKIGACSLLMRNAKDDSLYFGIPANRMDK